MNLPGELGMSTPPAPFRPSLLDRLLADGDARPLLAGLLGDLEDLLNTRTDRDIPAAFPEVRRSVLGYGLPDLGPLDALGPAQQAALCRAVTDAIGRYEPRLRRVRASWVAGSVGGGAAIVVDAELVTGSGRLALAIDRAGGRLRVRPTG